MQDSDLRHDELVHVSARELELEQRYLLSCHYERDYRRRLLKVPDLIESDELACNRSGEKRWEMKREEHRRRGSRELKRGGQSDSLERRFVIEKGLSRVRKREEKSRRRKVLVEVRKRRMKWVR